MNNANHTSVVKRNQQRVRRFVFTINNPTDLEINSLSLCNFTFLTYGKEHFANPGLTPHLQGCAVIGRQMAFSTLKKTPGFERAHIEQMKGTIEQAVAYCHKEDPTPFVLGDLPKPGKRNDILNAVQKLKSGTTIKQLVHDDDEAAVVFVKYHRGLQALATQLTPSRTNPPTIIWISGSTGSGKTRSTLEFADKLGLDFWISNESLQWFDGFNGQPVAIFDDYRTSFCKFGFLLRLLDRYPLRVPVKGGFVVWNPRYIFVTTPKSPEATWNLRTPEDIQQLVRRVSYQIIDQDYDSIRERLREVLDDTNLDGSDAGLLGGLVVPVPIVSDSEGTEEELMENKEDSYEDIYYTDLSK